MRIGRAIIIPAILVFGVAGSAVAGSAIPLAASHIGHVAKAHPRHTGGDASPDLFFHT
jgi:hypothetical protein